MLRTVLGGGAPDPQDPAFPHVYSYNNTLRRPLAPLSSEAFGKRFQSLLASVGLPTDKYAVHSLRIGGATAMYLAGVPAEVIMAIGQWRSDVFRDYIRLPVHRLAAASRVIGGAQSAWERSATGPPSRTHDTVSRNGFVSREKPGRSQVRPHQLQRCVPKPIQDPWMSIAPTVLMV